MKFYAPLVWLLVVSPAVCAQSEGTPEKYLRSRRERLALAVGAANIQPHDTIADVGAGSGRFDVALGITSDSAVFDLEDIHMGDLAPIYLKLRETIIAYEKIRQKPITHQYRFVEGTPTRTHLPTHHYNKVFFFDVFHHLAHRDSMLVELKRILKPDGELLVGDLVAFKSGEIYKPCKTVIYTAEEIIAAFEMHDFRFLKMYTNPKRRHSHVRYFAFAPHVK